MQTSAGELTVGRLTFDGYRAAKDAVIETLSSSLVETILASLSGPALDSIMSRFSARHKEIEEAKKAGKTGDELPPSWSAEDTAATLPLAVSQLRNDAGYIVSDIGRRVDEATSEIVKACVKEQDKLDEIDAFDFMELREAAFKVNDIAALVAMEKNFLTGAAPELAKRIAGLIRQK